LPGRASRQLQHKKMLPSQLIRKKNVASLLNSVTSHIKHEKSDAIDDKLAQIISLMTELDEGGEYTPQFVYYDIEHMLQKILDKRQHWLSHLDRNVLNEIKKY
jgi:hypothetical protein